MLSQTYCQSSESVKSVWQQGVLTEFGDVRLAYGVSDEYSFVLHKDTNLYGASQYFHLSACPAFWTLAVQVINTTAVTIDRPNMYVLAEKLPCFPVQPKCFKSQACLCYGRGPVVLLPVRRFGDCAHVQAGQGAALEGDWE